MIVIYINCALFPFIDLIIQGLKLYETRNRNTLKAFIGKRVYLAETGKGKKPLVCCSVFIDHMIRTTDKKTYNVFRKFTRIRKNSVYDWTSGTRQKCLYRFTDVKPCKPFLLPDNAIRKGRVYAIIPD